MSRYPSGPKVWGLGFQGLGLRVWVALMEVEWPQRGIARDWHPFEAFAPFPAGRQVAMSALYCAALVWLCGVLGPGIDGWSVDQEPGNRSASTAPQLHSTAPVNQLHDAHAALHPHSRCRGLMQASHASSLPHGTLPAVQWIVQSGPCCWCTGDPKVTDTPTTQPPTFEPSHAGACASQAQHGAARVCQLHAGRAGSPAAHVPAQRQCAGHRHGAAGGHHPGGVGQPQGARVHAAGLRVLPQGGAARFGVGGFGVYHRSRIRRRWQKKMGFHLFQSIGLIIRPACYPSHSSSTLGQSWPLPHERLHARDTLERSRLG